jgi:hypothetical protein
MKIKKVAWLLSGGEQAYSPLQELGAMFWYDFSALALAADAPITTLADLSGNGRTLTFDATKQPTNKTNILNGKGAALFDATNDGGYTTAFDWGSNEATFYALFTSASGTDNYVIAFGGASGDGRLFLYRQNANNEGSVFCSNNGAFSYDLTGAANPITTAPKILSGRIDLDSAQDAIIYLNGSATGSPQTGATGTANFGSGFVLQIGNRSAYDQALNGYLFEVLGFNVRHDLTAHARVIQYFQDKYFPAGFSFGVGDFADNAYSVIGSRSDGGTFVQTSPAARVVIETDADYGMVETYNDLGVSNGLGDCGMRVDGADFVALESTVSAKNLYSFYLGAAGTTRTVEFINGIQSKPSASRLGEWVTGAFFNGTAEIVSNAEPTSPRIYIYSDSIGGGQAAGNPSLQGWAQLVRNAYAAIGSVLSDAWGYRKLKDDCETEEQRTAFAAHVATVSPTTIWLAIGTNDSGAWASYVGGLFEAAYADMLDKLHAALPSAVIYAQTPIYKATDTGMPDIRTAIGNAQSSRSAFCTLVDGTGASFPQVVDLAPDGIHLPTAGQVKYGDAVIAVLGI